MKIIYAQKEIRWAIPSLRKVSLKKSLVFILFLFGSVVLHSQDLPNEMWHPGLVVLEEGDTLRGQIQYDFKTNLVQLAIDNKIKTFSSQQVLFLNFHCQFFKRFRYFYSIPYRLKGSMNVPVFFEILAEGRLTLMSREYVVVESINRYGNPMYRPLGVGGTREILTYDYYLLTDNGDINLYLEKKKDLLPYFGRYEDEMAKYIRKNKLKVDKQQDLVRIVNYYNEIVQE
ncbi:hypothetical protein GCM10011506_13840 [Marivirga lumbricoides]|uniref:Uncharacterized protein n=1 Tax=Marivirga lumbricoides TaxID=1046115 RepID=A0A2T4DTM0_9BACT|nr:hypothetical protein C9994_04175 [Marivirga lumbricoides]GGC29680.1 hypothetical protein GCM10011506_13840 [Marivirga lumbricoides]